MFYVSAMLLSSESENRVSSLLLRYSNKTRGIQDFKIACANRTQSPQAFGQRMGARRDSGELEFYLNFLIGCHVIVP